MGLDDSGVEEAGIPERSAVRELQAAAGGASGGRQVHSAGQIPHAQIHRHRTRRITGIHPPSIIHSIIHSNRLCLGAIPPVESQSVAHSQQPVRHGK